MENRIADPMELNYPGAEVIVNEDWDAIVCVARLLTERGILSRSELENEIFGSDIKMRVCLCASRCSSSRFRHSAGRTFAPCCQIAVALFLRILLPLLQLKLPTTTP